MSDNQNEQPVAKDGDNVIGVDTHIVIVEGTPTPQAMPFTGQLCSDLAKTVFVDEKQAAVIGSKADNVPQHIPIGGTFQKQPSNKGEISQGSATVFIEETGVARSADSVKCCNDFVDRDTAHIIASGTVISG